MESNLPLVTVVIPCYNHANYVTETIESIINQTYENIELIVIDDGSIDNSVQVIQKLADKYRFTFIHRPNKGLSGTLNEAVTLAKGKYFSAIASDDIILLNKISLLVEQLESLDDNYVAAFGDASFIDAHSNQIYLDFKTGSLATKEKGTNSFLDYYTYRRNIDYRNKDLFGSYNTLLSGNYLPAMSTVIKLDKIKEVGAWTNGNTIEDWEMWLKLSKKYKFIYVDEPVALYRWHENNSVKTMSKYLYYDTLKILKDEKKFAISKGFKDIYYNSLFILVIGIKLYSSKDFLLELIINFSNPYFLQLFIKKIKIKIFNDK